MTYFRLFVGIVVFMSVYSLSSNFVSAKSASVNNATQAIHDLVVDTNLVKLDKSLETKTHKKSSASDYDQNEFYQALVAEMYNQSKQPKLTLKHYLPIALKSNNPKLLKRVTEIATGSAQLKKGLVAAKHWVEISPQSLEAQQYYTLLLLRNEQFKQSALQLKIIRGIVDKQYADKKRADYESSSVQLNVSKGLKFIGALLIAESQHEKAYNVYSIYLSLRKKDSRYQDQENLILASLSMKAKEYEMVVSALDTIDLTNSEFFASAAVMKTKALRRLGRIEEASELLQRLVSTQKISDSLRLELTRLLVKIGKKDEAQIELEALVKKHPDNNDLLKALVALNITQKQWRKAKRNNEKLKKSQSYDNESAYFFGEIAEGQDDLRSALDFYKTVKKGVFLKKAYSKRVRIVAQLEGIKVVQRWLHTKQERSEKNKDKSYWLKLEADLLSDMKLSIGRDSRQDNLIRAIKLYDEIIVLSPKKNDYRYHRGLLFERSDQIKKAESDFKFVIEKGKLKADSLNALGYMLVKHTDRLDEAKVYIEKANELKPNDPLILDSLGWVYFKMGELTKAETYLRQAFKYLKSPEVASHLIAVLSETEKHQEARKIFNTMIKKYPNNASLDDIRGDLEHI